MIKKEGEIEYRHPYYKIVPYEEAIKFTRDHQNLGLTVVLTTGVYDLFHFKHAESLACISSLGHLTVVGIPGDNEVVRAAIGGNQDKATAGPIINFDRRSRMVSHLPYVDLIFKKTSDKYDLLINIQPDILAQSITSGVNVVAEILSAAERCGYTTSGGDLVINLPQRKCKVIFIDDIVDGRTKIIPFDIAIEKAKEWQSSKYAEGKFHGSLIKKTIINSFSRQTEE